MKKTIVAATMTALFGFSGASHAGLVTSDLTSGLTALDLVNSLLGSNSGITVSNVQYIGANSASGLFSGGSGIIGFDGGVVMTSGDASFVTGPNNHAGYSVNNGAPGDSILTSIIGINTNNASVLSFDFIPTSDFVQFSYVFGSEEYNQYTNSQFNDVFAFLVNGINYALVPGTNSPVAINTVNCGGPTGAGQPANHVNESNCQYFRDNPTSNPTIDTQLNGLTTVFTLIAPVTAGVVNTMYLAIADASDTSLDSAVFIKGGSFSGCGGIGQPACGGNAIPEPAGLALLGIGALGLGLRRKSTSRKTA